MSGQITGKVTVRLDGIVVPTENQATLNVGGVKREPETHGGRTYFSESEEAPMLECTVLQNKDFDAIELTNMTGATVIFEADTGQQYMMRKAFTTDPVSFEGSGKAPLKISCEQLDKV